jgi:tetratricopeptide (TPR) repeat protein
MRYLKSKTDQVNILVLDACRDNPFESKWNTTRSVKGGGLAKIPPPTGTLIAFSTDAGQTAADGEGANSVYSQSLAKNMLIEDISIDQVFRNVRTEVLNSTNGEQRPVEFTQLTGQEFFLNPGSYDDEFKVIESIIEDDKGDMFNALSLLEPILKEDPNNLRGLYFKVEIYNALKEYKKALVECDKLIALDAINSFYYLQSADTYVHLGNLDKALENYNTAIALAPEDSDYYYYRGVFYEDYKQDYAKALEDYDKSIKLNPTDPYLYFQRAILYQNKLNQPDKALENYLKVAEFQSDYPYIKYNIALIYENYIKDYDKALEYYTKEIELRPKDPLAYRNRAELYAYQLEDLDKALENYNTAIALAPEDSDYYYYRGVFYEDYKQDYAKALEDYDKSIKLNPTDPYLYFQRAILYQNKLNQPDKALENYLKVAEFQSDYPYIKYNIALIYENYIKDYDKALEYYTKEIELNPENYLGYMERAEFYTFSLKDYDKAKIDYNSAIELEPEDNNLNQSIINFHYIQEHFETVIDLVSKAMVKDLKDAQPNYIAALVHLKQNQDFKALNNLSISIERIKNYAHEDYYISNIDNSILDLSKVFVIRSKLYEKFGKQNLMCDDLNSALTYVKDDKLKNQIQNSIKEKCQ